MSEYKYRLVEVGYDNYVPEERGFSDPDNVTILLYEATDEPEDSEGVEVRLFPDYTHRFADIINAEGRLMLTTQGANKSLTLDDVKAIWHRAVEEGTYTADGPCNVVGRGDAQLYVESCLFKLLGMVLMEAGSHDNYHRLYAASETVDLRAVDVAGLWIRKTLNSMAGGYAERYPINMDYCEDPFMGGGLMFWIGESNRVITIPVLVLVFKMQRLDRLKGPGYRFE